jgi:hypothetical protein
MVAAGPGSAMLHDGMWRAAPDDHFVGVRRTYGESDTEKTG